MNHPLRNVFALAALSMLAACSGKPASGGAGRPAPHLQTLTVQPARAHREQTWDGVVEAVHEVTLTAQTNARVLALPHDVGDHVAKGEVLVRFTDVEQTSARRAARAQIASTRASYDNAEAAWRRVSAIYARGLVAKADLDQARASRDAALAALHAAQAQWRSAGQQVDYTVVRAPYAGVVTRRYVHVGEAVQAGPPSPQPLIALESLADLRVTVQVPQSAVAAIRRYQQAEVLRTDGKRLAAARVVVFPYADPRTHTFNVRLQLDGTQAGLYPGMTVKVAFAVGPAQRLLVPASALWHQGEVTGLFVVDGREVSLRQVRTGEHFGDRVEVLSGLAAGETVATDPAAAARYLSTLHAEPRA